MRLRKEYCEDKAEEVSEERQIGVIFPRRKQDWGIHFCKLFSLLSPRAIFFSTGKISQEVDLGINQGSVYCDHKATCYLFVDNFKCVFYS